MWRAMTKQHRGTPLTAAERELLQVCKLNSPEAESRLRAYLRGPTRSRNYEAVCGTAYLYLKQHAKARDHLTTALKRPDQRRLDILQNLLVAIDALNDVHGYERTTERMRREFPNAPQSAVAWAKVLNNRGHYEETLTHIRSTLGDTARTLLREIEGGRPGQNALPQADKPSVFDRQLLELAFIALNDSNQLNEAESLVSALIREFPDVTALLANKAIVELKKGQHREGFKNFQHRPTRPFGITPELEERAWTRVKLSQHIQVVAEQGLGDTLQFTRYLFGLTKIIPNVTFCPQDPLQALYRAIDVPFTLAYPNELEPKVPTVALMSLPYFMGEDGSTIRKHATYLRPKTQQRRRGIGLVWKGNQRYSNDLNRSVQLSNIIGIIEPLKPVIIQQDTTPEEDQILRAVNLEPRPLKNFAETQALLGTLAGVITVDTSVAHLSGSMGITTVIVLPHNSDWRWHDDQYVSRWYDTVYLVRRQATDRTGVEAFAHASMLMQELLQSKQL